MAYTKSIPPDLSEAITVSEDCILKLGKVPNVELLGRIDWWGARRDRRGSGQVGVWESANGSVMPVSGSVNERCLA